jgi:hypothetical protein
MTEAELADAMGEMDGDGSGEVGLGLGRFVVSEVQAPNMSVNLV